LYTVYKYFEVYILRKETTLSLIQFTSPVYKKIEYKKVGSFELYLNPDNGSVDKHIFVQGVWEPEIVTVMEDEIKEEYTCIDIGANIGHHTMCMAMLSKGGTVHAFEPIELLCEQIQHSLTKNNIHNVILHPYGLSSSTEEKTIHIDVLNIGKSTFDTRTKNTTELRAQVKVFDTIWDTKQKIDFIKMDVEGYELNVFMGMRNAIESYHPKILFEYSPIFYHKNGTQGSEILDFLLGNGYRIFDIENNLAEVTKSQLDDFLRTLQTQTNLLCKVL
jgi:FkbM family methyltransferase